MKEHAGGGAVNFSMRREKEKVESLKLVSLRTAARKIYDVIKFGGKDAERNGKGKSLVGWDTNRDTTNQADILAFQQGVHDLSEETANLLLLKVLQLSHQALQIPNQPGVSTIAINQIFFSDRISKLSLSNLHFHPSLLNSIPQCTSLVDLDLAHNEMLADSVLAKVLGRIPSLRRINLKASTKVGDKSIIALAQGAGVNLQVANLSFTAVGVKGLAALLGACPSLEVLKLQAVSNLVRRRSLSVVVSKLTHETWQSGRTRKTSIRSSKPPWVSFFEMLFSQEVPNVLPVPVESANKVKAIPLANLKTLKLKNTHVTDAALGRLLTLCAPTLTRLDISFTDVKSLDIISSALHTLPTWNLEKIVASALPLTPASLESFFRPLAQNRTPEERNRLKVIKLGSIPATSARAPGMTDAVLTKLLPYWETFEGLEKVSLHGNVYLGKSKNPMYSFLSTIGSRCRVSVPSHTVRRLSRSDSRLRGTGSRLDQHSYRF